MTSNTVWLDYTNSFPRILSYFVVPQNMDYVHSEYLHSILVIIISIILRAELDTAEDFRMTIYHRVYT